MERPRPTLLIANPSPDVYGSDLQMLETVSAMRAEDWRVVVTVPGDGPLVPRLRERGAEVEFLRYPVLRRANQSVGAFLGMAAAAAAAVPRLLGYLARTRPTVVYVNTVTLPWWLLAARLGRVPVVCHLHEAENTDRALVRRALVLPLRLAHAVIVISRSALQAMVDADPRLGRRGVLVYNGVPEPPTEPRPPSRRPPLRLAVVGRLSPRKAPHLALEAAARLRERGVPVVVELAGTAFEGYDWYVAELRERAARPDLTGAVEFSGYQSPIWPTLERADLVVAPSLREPFGNAVVEAQLAGRPVVATAALGHLESITDGETGLLVPPGDVAAMAAAIERLVVDADLAETLAATARRQALDRFSVARYRREVADVVSGLAPGRRPGGART